MTPVSYSKLFKKRRKMSKTGDKLCLKWHGFQESAGLAFANLQTKMDFADVTLACEDGPAVEAHKLVLSSSSPFFENLLRRTSHPHPLIYLRGVKSSDLSALLDFIYQGEANVGQENLEVFLALAQELELTGLTTGAEELNLRSSENGTCGTNLPAFDSDRKVGMTSNSIRATSISPHSTDNIEDSTTKASDKKLNDNSDNSVNLKNLDDQIKSMMCKSENTLQGKNWECNLCGKEGIKDAIRKHIEAHHITGVVHFCEVCGKASKSRNALTVHKSTNHRRLSQ